MTAFDSYKMYVALKLHFTSDSYDFFKFQGKTKVTETNFQKRKDRYFFEKLSKKVKDDEMPLYFVSNFVLDKDNWIGSMIGNDGTETYIKWKKRIESLFYTFTEDVDFLLSQVDDFEDLFKVTGTHPLLLKYYLGSKISIESFVILNKILDFIPQFDKQIKEQLIWQNVRRTVLKYSPFISFDMIKYKKELKEKVLDHKCLSSIQK